MAAEKILTSFKISKTIHLQLNQAVVAAGYGLRGKSRWLLEAVETLLAMSPKDYAELVDIASEMNELSEVISIRLPNETMKLMEAAVIAIRQYYPSMEGVKSNIIRAAILQQLIRY